MVGNPVDEVKNDTNGTIVTDNLRTNVSTNEERSIGGKGYSILGHVCTAEMEDVSRNRVQGTDKAVTYADVTRNSLNVKYIDETGIDLIIKIKFNVTSELLYAYTNEDSYSNCATANTIYDLLSVP